MEVLQAAWERVCANDGAPGVDGVTIQAIKSSPERVSGNLPVRFDEGGLNLRNHCSSAAKGLSPLSRLTRSCGCGKHARSAGTENNDIVGYCGISHGVQSVVTQASCLHRKNDKSRRDACGTYNYRCPRSSLLGKALIPGPSLIRARGGDILRNGRRFALAIYAGDGAFRGGQQQA